MRKGLLLLLLGILFFIQACTLSTTTTSLTASNSSTTTQSTTTVSTSESETNPVSYETLFQRENYKKFTLYFSKANFDKLIDDMENYYDEFGSYRDNTIQEVDMVYEDGYGNILSVNEVGFRTKGNIFSRRLPIVRDELGNVIGYQQVSFQLEFNDAFDYPINSTQYKTLRARRVFDLEQLNFKYIRDYDTSAVTEMAGYDYFRMIGVPAPNTAMAIIYFNIDGVEIPYGLFTVTEPVDDVFARRYFGKNADGTIGDLYKCVWQDPGPANLKNDLNSRKLGVSDYNEGYRKTYQLKTNRTTSNYADFYYFIDRLNQPSLPNYENVLLQILDVDTWLKTLAMAFLVGNPDDYRSDANNYYLYFYENKAVYIPFDYDQSLGFGWNPYGDYGISNNVWSYPPAQSYLGQASDLPLVHNILNISTFRTTYENYLLAYTDATSGAFNVQIFKDLFDVIKPLYEAEVVVANHLGLRVFSLEQRDMNIDTYFTEKIQSTRNQILATR